jgi:sodium/potassium-transporting ATPase subunit alpha
MQITAKLNQSSVNERTILARKKRALLRHRTLTRDVETQEVIQPSRFQAIIAKIKTPFSRDFWERKFEPTEDETLVDSKLLSYSYLEAGLIETLGP